MSQIGDMLALAVPGIVRFLMLYWRSSSEHLATDTVQSSDAGFRIADSIIRSVGDSSFVADKQSGLWARLGCSSVAYLKLGLEGSQPTGFAWHRYKLFDYAEKYWGQGG